MNLGETKIEQWIARDLQAFARVSASDRDALMSMRRAGLLMASYIKQVLMASLPRGRILAEVDLTLRQEIALLSALDLLDETVIHCLNGLEDLSHTMHQDLTDDLLPVKIGSLRDILQKSFSEFAQPYRNLQNRMLWMLLCGIFRILNPGGEDVD